ncbi:MAG: outer-membrane lipoprotein carrier protein LolA [Acidobacteria bacterium]|nr:outer-membrane lipoprotein carrier protein LolA [Acidobacteriota bacterium]
MKNILQRGLIAITFVFISAALTGTAHAQQNNEVLKRMEAYRQRLVTMRSNVTYEKYESNLNDRESREGRMIYLKNGNTKYFRIDWSKPNESFAVIGDTYKLYQPSQSMLHVGKTGSAAKSAGASGPLGLLSMSREQIKSSFTIKYLGEEKVNGTTAAIHLELTPTGKQSFKVADIWVNGDGLPVQMRTTAPNNDTQTVLLTRVEENPTLNGPDFEINPSAGTKIIRD